MVQSPPRTTLKVVEPQFPLQLLVTLFNRPALVGQPHQFSPRRVGRQPFQPSRLMVRIGLYSVICALFGLTAGYCIAYYAGVLIRSHRPVAA